MSTKPETCQHENAYFEARDEMGAEGYYLRDALICDDCDGFMWSEDER